MRISARSISVTPRRLPWPVAWRKQGQLSDKGWNSRRTVRQQRSARRPLENRNWPRVVAKLESRELLALTRCDRTGSGGKRPRNAKAKVGEADTGRVNVPRCGADSRRAVGP